ncbi:MAG TPA: hypothetical protein DHW82_03070 [Spirochaetia bacterium]|nr:hypothetical protein [Spirochaetia bacterium]
MKKIIFISAFLFLGQVLYGEVLKKINFPETWEIESVEKNENIAVENIEIPVYIKQVVKTQNDNLIIHYYECGSTELASKLFEAFFQKQESVYKKNTTLYRLEGNAKDIKNTLRFLELPLLEQVKIIFPEIKEISSTNLLSENEIQEADLKNTETQLGIKIKKGMAQIYNFPESVVKLELSIYLCQDKNEARVGYNNGRVKNFNDLVSYMIAEDFLVRIKWVK